MSHTRTMQIYLAAPLFSQAEWQWNSELVSKLRATGYEVTVPQEAAWPMVAKQKDFNPTELFTSNVAAIDQSSVVLAVLDGTALLDFVVEVVGIVERRRQLNDIGHQLDVTGYRAPVTHDLALTPAQQELSRTLQGRGGSK